MGQYYKVVNLDKKEYLYPHNFEDGAKLMEFGISGMGTMAALAVLLADGNNRGGGDLHSDDPLIGSWAGDRIVVTGDYADDGKFVENTDRETLKQAAKEGFVEEDQDNEVINLYHLAEGIFQDISEKVITVMMDDPFLKESLLKAGIKEPVAKRLQG